ncbi:hypothetical protein LBMAG27_10600 [Bacteroidota bacterium]|nr:hypothetical protein LBMAG27_10600 [Bacteroidota bacterium]
MKINRTNYEDFLIQKLEGLLSTEQNAELDLFLHNNADIKSEWEAFEQTVMVPDETIVYEHKELLKKKVGGVIPIYSTMLFVTSIAASLLLVFFVSQKYLIHQPTEKPIDVAVNNSAQNKSTGISVPVVQPSNNNTIVADNFTNKTQPTSSNQSSIKNYQIINVNQTGTTNSKSETIAAISYMKTLSPTAMKIYPRISYASFIWTKGLKIPNVPAHNVSEAGAWLQVASILGTEIIRLSGRGDWVNTAPIELQIKNKPVELNIHNSYLHLHKILSFKNKNSNNK